MPLECRSVPRHQPSYMRSAGSRLWPGRCAYCGKDGPETEDHVIPRCLYPVGWAPDEYLTVPSHRTCNSGFSLAETAFKEDLSTAGSNGAAAMSRDSVVRSFGRDRRRGRKLLERLSEGKIFPHRNADTVRVMRKVVRGIAYYHGLFPSLPSELIAISPAKYLIPPSFLTEARFHEVRHPDVFECSCFVIGDLPGDGPVHRSEHSFWRLRFYDRVMFDAWVTAPPDRPR